MSYERSAQRGDQANGYKPKPYSETSRVQSVDFGDDRECDALAPNGPWLPNPADPPHRSEDAPNVWFGAHHNRPRRIPDRLCRCRVRSCTAKLVPSMKIRPVTPAVAKHFRSLEPAMAFILLVG